MVIKINGKEEKMEREASLHELIVAKGLVPDHIVVEHNHNIISKDEWHRTRLNDNDNIEIISFVGGG